MVVVIVVVIPIINALMSSNKLIHRLDVKRTNYTTQINNRSVQ